MPTLLALPPVPRRHRIAPATTPWRVLLAASGLAASLGLLAGIAQVMHEAARQGELRREATARHSAATWHCNTLRSMRLRDACLRELDAPPPREVLIGALPG